MHLSRESASERIVRWKIHSTLSITSWSTAGLLVFDEHGNAVGLSPRASNAPTDRPGLLRPIVQETNVADVKIRSLTKPS